MEMTNHTNKIKTLLKEIVTSFKLSALLNKSSHVKHEENLHETLHSVGCLLTVDGAESRQTRLTGCHGPVYEL